MKLVDIKMLVKHDSKVFYPGERRMMEDSEAAYFQQHGWGSVDGEVVAAAPAPGDVTLAVQDGNHRSKTKVG